MHYLTHYKKHLGIAWPIALGQVGHVIVGLSDSIMIGQLGTYPLAASSLANGIFSILIVFGLGASYGITPPVANAHARNDKNALRAILPQGLVLNNILGIILFLLVIAFIPVFGYLDQEPLVADLASPYFAIIGLSTIPFMTYMATKQYCEGLSLTRMAMVISLGGNLLNIGLNYLLIYGNYGFPRLELEGAGYATLISRVIMALSMLAYIKYHKDLNGLVTKLWTTKIDKKIFRKLLKIGIPSGVQYTVEVSAFAIAAIIVGWIGAKELAAHQIALSLAALSYMMATGLSSGAMVRVGNAMGRKNIPEIRKTGFTAFHISVLFMAIPAVIFALGRNIFPAYYIDDSQVIAMASSLLIIAAFFQLSDGLQVVGLGALRGMEDVKWPTIFIIFAYWVIGLPLGYYLGIKTSLGVNGVWIGLLVGLTITAVFHISRFHILTKKMNN
ncbi:MAG: MATE family multidrug resistance protein [Sphingobacteriales bacterium]